MSVMLTSPPPHLNIKTANQNVPIRSTCWPCITSVLSSLPQTSTPRSPQATPCFQSLSTHLHLLMTTNPVSCRLLNITCEQPPARLTLPPLSLCPVIYTDLHPDCAVSQLTWAILYPPVWEDCSLCRHVFPSLSGKQNSLWLCLINLNSVHIVYSNCSLLIKHQIAASFHIVELLNCGFLWHCVFCQECIVLLSAPVNQVLSFACNAALFRPMQLNPCRKWWFWNAWNHTPVHAVLTCNNSLDSNKTTEIWLTEWIARFHTGAPVPPTTEKPSVRQKHVLFYGEKKQSM